MNAKSFTLALASLAVVSGSSVPAGWTYGGCMILDHFEENISPPYVDTVDSTSMTIGLCLSTCTTPYAGIDANVCYCGTTSFPTLDPTLDYECDTPCPGDASETCGGATGFGWVSLYSKSGNSTSSSSSTSSLISTSAPLSYTTSIIYSTSTETITSCAATVTNCPARTSTTVYSVGTTVVPCSSASATSSAVLSTPTTTFIIPSNSTGIITSTPKSSLLTSTTAAGSNSTLKATATPTPTASSVATGDASVVGRWGSAAMLVLVGMVALL